MNITFLQDQANFHKSWAWQIVLIFNIEKLPWAREIMILMCQIIKIVTMQLIDDTLFISISIQADIVTRGQFWPSGIVVACVCVCVSVCLSVRMCVNHLLVRVITRDLFKLGSPNLDQRCKRPWLRSLLFWGAIDLDLQGQI